MHSDLFGIFYMDPCKRSIFLNNKEGKFLSFFSADY